MARWQPDAPGRLQAAALELYGTQGFDETTVAEIAERAGLTKRTFFRYFADKREVLFYGARDFEALWVSAIAEAPETATPLAAVEAALDAVAADFEDRREHAARRARIIAANPELQERELMKLASLATTVAGALRARGVTDPAATLTAEAALTVFRVAFERWAGPCATGPLRTVIRESLDELRAVTAR